MTRQSSSTTLPEPLRSVASGLRRVPGAGMVSRAAEGALDRVGAVSPRGRRMVVYTGAGVLGVVGVVEWPIALTGAAVAWLTQPRPEEHHDATGTGETKETVQPTEAAAGKGTGASKRTGTRQTASGRSKSAAAQGSPTTKSGTAGSVG
ncbi:hypothetical protein [Streptomyces sp. S.PB5]|uniref:hypothetical protein n=1 Tax=Streptomyces sp. S.PB5 TaxID=3020844 RepID=UPI0025B1C665|nr:hypothetical protein [Streptomyces sp. S.PB5]MDN3025795.1 hypothetical protein [Streptomyces sp. S.PB5]